MGRHKSTEIIQYQIVLESDKELIRRRWKRGDAPLSIALDLGMPYDQVCNIVGCHINPSCAIKKEPPVRLTTIRRRRKKKQIEN